MTANRLRWVKGLYNIIMFSIIIGFVALPVAGITEMVYEYTSTTGDTAFTLNWGPMLALTYIFFTALAFYIWMFVIRGNPDIHVEHMGDMNRLTGFSVFTFTCAVAFAAMGVLSARFGFYHLARGFYPFLVLVISVGYPMYVRMVLLDKTLSAISIASVQPVKRILDFDNRVIACLTGGIILFVLGFSLVFVGPFITAARHIPLPDPMTIMTYTPEDDYADDLYAELERIIEILQEDVEEWRTIRIPEGIRRFLELFMFYLQRVLTFFTLTFLIVVTIAIIAGAVYLIVNMWRRYGRRRSRPPLTLDSQEEEMGYTDIEEREFILPVLNFKRRKITSPKDPIRKKFRDKIMEHMKRGVWIPASDTPTEMARRITTEDIRHLASEYSKTRYDEKL